MTMDEETKKLLQNLAQQPLNVDVHFMGRCSACEAREGPLRSP